MKKLLLILAIILVSTNSANAQIISLGGSKPSSLITTSQENINKGDIVRIYNDGTGYNKSYKLFSNVPYNIGSLYALNFNKITDFTTTDSEGYFVGVGMPALTFGGNGGSLYFIIYLFRMLDKKVSLINTYELSGAGISSGVSAIPIKILRLSETQYAVVLAGTLPNYNASNSVYGVAITRTSNTLNIGTPERFIGFAGIPSFFDIQSCQNGTHILIAMHQNSLNNQTVMVASASGTTWTWGSYTAGTNQVRGTALNDQNSVFQIVYDTSGYFYCLHTDSVDANKNKICVGQWDGALGITGWGAAVVLDTLTTANPRLVGGNDGYAMITYGISLTSPISVSNGFRVVVVSRSGTSTTVYTPTDIYYNTNKRVYHATTSWYNSLLLRENSTTFMEKIQYGIDAEDHYSYVRIVRNGTSITYSFKRHPLGMSASSPTFTNPSNKAVETNLIFYTPLLLQCAPCFIKIDYSKDWVSTVYNFIIGVANITTTTGNTLECSLSYNGSITNTAWNLTSGNKYYVDMDTSQLTNVSSGNLMTPAGIAINSTTLMPFYGIEQNTTGYGKTYINSIWNYSQW